MPSTLNRYAYERLIVEDLEWLTARMPEGLERGHIACVLLESVSERYPRGVGESDWWAPDHVKRLEAIGLHPSRHAPLEAGALDSPELEPQHLRSGELRCLSHLAMAWNCHSTLKELSPHERDELRAAINAAQTLVMARVAVRTNPGLLVDRSQEPSG